jgi:hypothetical protein
MMQMLQVIGGQSLPELNFVSSYAVTTDGSNINLGTRGIGPVPTRGDRLVVVLIGLDTTANSINVTINGNNMTRVVYDDGQIVGAACGIYSYVLNTGTTAAFRAIASNNNIVNSIVGTYGLYNLESTTARDTDNITATGQAVSVTVLNNAIALAGFRGTSGTAVSGYTTLSEDFDVTSEGARFAGASGSELAAGTVTEDPTGGGRARCMATWR